jgi:hypothetical protein
MILHLASHALHHVDLGSCMCICDRSRGAEIRDKKEEVHGALGGPQASSCEDASIIVIKASPGAFNQYSLSFSLNVALCYSWLFIKLIGVV